VICGGGVGETEPQRDGNHAKRSPAKPASLGSQCRPTTGFADARLCIPDTTGGFIGHLAAAPHKGRLLVREAFFVMQGRILER
jgi:hypothetical protein